MRRDDGRSLFRIPLWILFASMCLAFQAQPSGPIVMAPQIRTSVEPTYTDEALQARLLGVAVLDVLVDEHGVPTDVRLVKWTSENRLNPDPLGLDEAAIEAVRQWRYSPKTVNGKPASFRTTVEIHFGRELLLRQSLRQRKLASLPIPIILCSGLPGIPILVMRGPEITLDLKGEESIPGLVHEWDPLPPELK